MTSVQEFCIDNEPNLLIGRRVVCIKDFDGNSEIVGKTGTVVRTPSIPKLFWCSVEYDEHLTRGHSSGGAGKYGYCWDTGFDSLEFDE